MVTLVFCAGMRDNAGPASEAAGCKGPKVWSGAVEYGLGVCKCRITMADLMCLALQCHLLKASIVVMVHVADVLMACRFYCCQTAFGFVDSRC